VGLKFTKQVSTPTEQEDVTMPSPSTVERLVAAERELDQTIALLEKLWVERQALYAAIRELRTLRRNIELARGSLKKE